MKTIFDTIGSPAGHFCFADVKSICSWTPWKTNLVSPSPTKASTPFERYRSCFFACSSAFMNLLNFSASSGFDVVSPSEPTPDRSCFFFFGGGGVGGSPFGGGGGGFGRAQRTRGPAQGDDLRADLELDFKTACFGGQEKVRITHLESCGKCKGDGIEPGAKVTTCDTCRGSGVVMQVTRTPLGNFQTQSACPTCQGTGQSVEAYCAKCNGQGVERKAKQVSVTIPCGVDAGNRLRVAGEGDAGPRGGAAGDLYIFLDVKKDPVFTRDGVDVASSMEVSAADAALGCSVATPTLDEDACEVKVPAGTQPGTKLRLKGKGAPALSKPAQRGDLYVTVNVKVPTSLSDEERRLMEQLRDLQAK